MLQGNAVFSGHAEDIGGELKAKLVSFDEIVK
jgi:hypothetical protein